MSVEIKRTLVCDLCGKRHDVPERAIREGEFKPPLGWGTATLKRWAKTKHEITGLGGGFVSGVAGDTEHWQHIIAGMGVEQDICPDCINTIEKAVDGLKARP